MGVRVIYTSQEGETLLGAQVFAPSSFGLSI